MTVQENFGKIIQRLRKRYGISQEALALSAKIDRRYMSDIENGKRNISIEIVDRLANFFHVPLYEMFDLTLSADKESDKGLEELKKWLMDHDFSDTVILESPDYFSAIIGISDDGRLVYSYRKMVDFLVDTDDMSEDEAIEFIDYNTVNALPYMGEKAPIIMQDINL